MSLINILVYVLIGSSFLFLLMIAGYKLYTRNAQQSGRADVNKTYADYIGSNKSKRVKAYNQFLQDSYFAYIKVPFLKAYILRIRKRLQSIHSYDEFTMRRETMKIVFYTLAIVTSFVIVLLFMNKGLTSIFMLLLTAVVIHGTLIDTFVNRVENRLLNQLNLVLTDVRNEYQQHGMIDIALHDAAEASTHEASLHAQKVYEILSASDPEKELEIYYQSAPNRFLKTFAGISFLVKEFGDKVIEKGSLYLNNLEKLSNEINLEILKRTKLNYFLKGLTIISIVPILFTTPIELWAKNNFPSMEEFYNSKLGFFLKITIFAVILISYVLLKKLQDEQEGTYQAKVKKVLWEQKLLTIPFIEWVVDRFIPNRRTSEYYRINTLLKDANAGIPLDWHYLHRILLAVALFIIMMSSFFSTHYLTVQNILELPTQSSSMFGKLSDKELKVAQETTALDTQILNQVKEVNNEQASDQIGTLVRNNPEIASNSKLYFSTVERIQQKLDDINSEYFKWYEFLIALTVAVMGYYFPSWILLFQKKLRAIDMQNEVEQFHTIIAMLCEIDRMSVDIMVEWMERFSSIFKAPLHKCVLNYEAGAELALNQVKIDAPFLPFSQLIDKLIHSVEKVPIIQAFDNLESERTNNFEKRKHAYEVMIQTKAEWGRLIGFAPMSAVIFLYLVFPFIYMSYMDMGTYYQQMNTLN
ncbi:hypothetical protein PaeCFBP13512_22505 [Paenibacillus sp. CFBP13512]|nr:hypothetical protein [Paenibacillus sp. CFBP13512]TKJ83704.1 hypothetical protein PaeCFBP13512_22505 [Paenibacillus sp. CFBP13512]